MLVVDLKQGESITVEAGSMTYMTPSIDVETRRRGSQEGGDLSDAHRASEPGTRAVGGRKERRWIAACLENIAMFHGRLAVRCCPGLPLRFAWTPSPSPSTKSPGTNLRGNPGQHRTTRAPKWKHSDISKALL